MKPDNPIMQKAFEARRAYADLKQAQSLLMDEQLVWSPDFEAIRKPLQRAIGIYAMKMQYDNAPLLEIARILIAEENDLSIGD